MKLPHRMLNPLPQRRRIEAAKISIDHPLVRLCGCVCVCVCVSVSVSVSVCSRLFEASLRC
jgi:hypothetical protein